MYVNKFGKISLCCFFFPIWSRIRTPDSVASKVPLRLLTLRSLSWDNLTRPNVLMRWPYVAKASRPPRCVHASELSSGEWYRGFLNCSKHCQFTPFTTCSSMQSWFQLLGNVGPAQSGSSDFFNVFMAERLASYSAYRFRCRSAGYTMLCLDATILSSWNRNIPRRLRPCAEVLRIWDVLSQFGHLR